MRRLRPVNPSLPCLAIPQTRMSNPAAGADVQPCPARIHRRHSIAMNVAANTGLDPAEIVPRLSRADKTQPQALRAGPENARLDAQPNPFREFRGLHANRNWNLRAERIATSFAEACTPAALSGCPHHRIGRQALELSMRPIRMERIRPDRWAVALQSIERQSSSHPKPNPLTQTCRARRTGLQNHYLSRDQCPRTAVPGKLPRHTCRLWIGLSSVQWREAWKYGERAFRYCQLDVAMPSARSAMPRARWDGAPRWSRIQETLNSRH